MTKEENVTFIRNISPPALYLITRNVVFTLDMNSSFSNNLLFRGPCLPTGTPLTCHIAMTGGKTFIMVPPVVPAVFTQPELAGGRLVSLQDALKFPSGLTKWKNPFNPKIFERIAKFRQENLLFHCKCTTSQTTLTSVSLTGTCQLYFYHLIF